MAATARELVYQTVRREKPARAPRQLWRLPWAEWNYPAELSAILRDYPDDIVHIDGHVARPAPTSGDPYRVGSFVDEWNCTFRNIQDGLIGEVKEPPVTNWDTDAQNVHIPREMLAIDRDAVNRDCDSTDSFTIAGTSANPFERLQFIRGTEALYMDLADRTPKMLDFLHDMHAYYCDVLSAWAKTDVDALMIGDDWGSQRSLLIRPAIWREVFRPLYRDYIQIAHGAGKKLFLHSDGHILAIFPDLIDLGVDAVNSQIFCMGVETLRPFAGRITFWGEIDRQHLLPHGTAADIDRAVRSVHNALWADGGCIAQCEFTAGSRPENVRQVFASWDAVTGQP
ncbi:MAG TPA: uroporphyrinogen decarboxylase family protein [Armatimonadota bacterium]|jgi:hypothetical protein